MFPLKLHLKYLFVWSSWFIGKSFIKFENERRKGKFSSVDRLGQSPWMS